jgi:HK97 family phage portal protein
MLASMRTALAEWRYGPLLKALQQQQSLPSPAGQLAIKAQNLKDPVKTPARFDALAKEGYAGNVIVFRSVNIIATAVAGIPWRAYKRKGTAVKGAEVESHPLLDLLAKPNEDMAGPAFMERYVAFLLIAGNSYVQALRPMTRNAPPLQLEVLRPDRMKVVPGTNGRAGGFQYAIGNEKMPLDRADVLHSKLFHALDDWYGLSPLAVASLAVDIHNAGQEWNLALLQNSGRLPGFFVTPQRLGEVQYSRMLQQLLDRYTGSRNAGLPGLLEQNLDWKPSGMPPSDMEWGALSREEGRLIAVALGVPSELLSDATNKTYSNFKEARASLYTETVLPLMDRIAGDLNGWLPSMYPGAPIMLAYDRNDIEALQEDRDAVFRRVNGANFMTVDEKRAAVGLEPYEPSTDEPGGVIVLPSNFATLEAIVEGTAKADTQLVNDVPPAPGADPTADPASAGSPAPGADPLDDLGAPPAGGDDAPPAPEGDAGAKRLRSIWLRDTLDDLDAIPALAGRR